jgi:hypothetical protein
VSITARAAVPKTPSTKAGMLVDAFTAVPVWVVSPVLRRWHMRWGAATEEVTAAMPGDDVVPRAQFNATRAITIDARPEDVWPWIMQLGYGRAGDSAPWTGNAGPLPHRWTGSWTRSREAGYWAQTS